MLPEDIEAELAALRSALRTAPAEAASAQAPDQPAASTEAHRLQIAELVQQIRDQVSTFAGEVDETVASHPIAALSAAFLLGFAAGQLTRGRQA